VGLGMTAKRVVTLISLVLLTLARAWLLSPGLQVMTLIGRVRLMTPLLQL